ncbi:hypothetical protein BT96DRAFT_1033284 [Gymnopus androsaceus JB14]|uniref:Uncharacterized protein n=1 Tax=Gymnopus androsaceus JB14 TaxID=1447944 RepID=A0A6A4GDD0_9AGAR|nr:hypothetical protein BT96DRAFT_1033284 [Gymnopus androsaceus JB14]
MVDLFIPRDTTLVPSSVPSSALFSNISVTHTPSVPRSPILNTTFITSGTSFLSNFSFPSFSISPGSKSSGPTFVTFTPPETALGSPSEPKSVLNSLSISPLPLFATPKSTSSHYVPTGPSTFTSLSTQDSSMSNIVSTIPSSIQELSTLRDTRITAISTSSFLVTAIASSIQKPSPTLRDTSSLGTAIPTSSLLEMSTPADTSQVHHCKLHQQYSSEGIS